MEPFAPVVASYRDFASYAGGESPCLVEWALGVADDPEVSGWISALPGIKQQPNLVFAAARWHGVPAPGPYAGLRDALLGDDGRIRRTIQSRSTQTNEVGRLATLLPAFASVPGPLALLEVGASAGLCLYPDRYDYAWHSTADGPPVTHRLTGSGGPTLSSLTGGPVPYPTSPVEVAWRGGIDLHPLDVTDDDAMTWLQGLVWPEQDERRVRLADAVAIARADPPHLVGGDLLVELPSLLAEAGRHGTPVVFHSAVAAYLEVEDRARLQSLMSGLVADGACHWVSNEGKRVLPDVTASGPDVPEELATFVLGVDGQSVAWTHPHGATMTWL